MNGKPNLKRGCAGWIAVVLACWAMVPAPPAMSQEGPEDAAPAPEAYLLKAFGQILSGQCIQTVTPELALVEGQVSAEALRAVEAAEKLRSGMEPIKAYVEEIEGELRVLETVRTVRPVDLEAAIAQEGQRPFRSVRRFQVSLSARANIDEILDTLYRLGMEPPEYGERASRGDRRHPAVVYGFSDLKARLGGLLEECRENAVGDWCAVNAPVRERNVCVSSLKRYGRYISIASSTVQSSASVRTFESGTWQNNLLRFSYPFDATPAGGIKLVGDGPVSLKGVVSLRVASP